MKKLLVGTFIGFVAVSAPHNNAGRAPLFAALGLGCVQTCVPNKTKPTHDGMQNDVPIRSSAVV